MDGQKRILSVGQCGVDGPRIERFLTRSLQAEVDGADSLEEAVEKVGAGRYDLVLVNRELHEDGSPGVEVVAAVKAAVPEVLVMLVSDKKEAQAEAVGRGAVEGIGKAGLSDPATLERLKSALRIG